MSDPARQLKAVGEATQTMHGVAEQALEWVKVSEERVVRAEARVGKVRSELKERALEQLRGVSAEARERIAAERKARLAAEAKVSAAERSRDRAEKAFEDLQTRAQAEREEILAQASRASGEADRIVAEANDTVDRKVERLVAEVRGAEDELAATWQPLAAAFAEVVRDFHRDSGSPAR